jgi:alkyldihydroxyacetonephosphate synthase
MSTRDMKWWGWGEESVAFTHTDKPALAPFVASHLGIDLDRVMAAPPALAEVSLVPPISAPSLHEALVAIVGVEHVSDEPLDRVRHGHGKSLRDLVLVRAGEFGRLPDLVVTPADETEVAAVVRAILDAGAVVIPFGGGSNIVGSLSAPDGEPRVCVSVDLRRMDRVVEIDPVARVARVQAGALGPDLEDQLHERGYTLGHFPDSFAHSTLGGWIATRSSGMQSDKYGDIADLTRAVRVVTPVGMLVTRNVPSTSTGPSVREMVLGSEGRLGVITEATVQVHAIPAERRILGYFFPTWTAAVAAMRDLSAADLALSVTRGADAHETQFSLATKKGSASWRDELVDRAKSLALKRFLRHRKGYDLSQACLGFIGYEGTEDAVERRRKAVSSIIGPHGGVCVGRGPGALYDQKKFDTPYIRDFLLDRGVLADVSETAAPWSVLPSLYDAAKRAATERFTALGLRGFIMCHLSHSYHSGACLYFTFAFVPSSTADSLLQYDVIKSAVQRAFVDNGATLSHHHAVGTEHRSWLEQDISGPGVLMLHALFDGIDPTGQCNPGKIVP